jgi:SAM-dependent methyltransferase
MYSKWPYPSQVAGKPLIYDLANLFQILLPAETLSGARVLDAGCGTGHRLVAFAKRFPEARFTGIDNAERALVIARQLSAEHGVTNVRFVHIDLFDLDSLGAFDIITATGVLHHLEQPAAGLAQLCRLLRPDGIISIWLYHSFGEFRRINARELLRALWTDEADHAVGVALMRDLELSLDVHQYGSSAAQSERHWDREGIDVDAFMHPIVETYRFTEALAKYAECPVDWVAVNGINRRGESHLIDLEEVEEELRPLCVPIERLLKTPALMSRYLSLSKIDKLRVLELLMEPTGFTVLAGRGNSLSRLRPRVRGNSVPFHVGGVSDQSGGR